ncbi:hypothetical protein [Sphaerisporangium aureirubrum]|uniref:Uncharacterized protein n=1 Tax=Sphaerisporangium aureirubrum TaxID=1544736 RepID=A0ABW1NT38_9ACTN
MTIQRTFQSFPVFRGGHEDEVPVNGEVIPEMEDGTTVGQTIRNGHERSHPA